MNIARNTEKDSAKQNRQFLALTLQLAGAQNCHKAQIKCPFHDDKKPSAAIRQAHSGNWYFYCYVCDISDDVWALKARLEGREVGQILKNETRSMQTDTAQKSQHTFKTQGESFASFDELLQAWKKRNLQAQLQEINRYTDPATNDFSYATLRILPANTEKKEFRQVSKNEKGRWQWTEPSGKLPLFNRVRIKDCDTVIIFEGEKCVREFTKLGFASICGTTAPQGANGANKTDWQPLAGKNCIIWRDNDAPGEKYEAHVIEILNKLSPPCIVSRVRVLDLELAPKQDIVDYLATVDGTPEDKRAAIFLVLQDVETLNVTEALADRLRKIASGEFRSIPFPQMPVLSNQSKALMPGTLTTICGEPGAGKTFLLVENFWRWNLEHNIKVKLLMLEDDNAFYQMRVLAQMSGYADLTDTDFIEDNVDFAQAIFTEYRENLEYFFRNLETTKSEQKTLDEIAEWVKIQAENGIEIIGVDPITAAKVSDKPYIDDQRFLFKVKEVLERTGARLILSTHPRLGQAGKPSLSGMAGGASYPRFSQTVFWLKNFEKAQTSHVWIAGTSQQTPYKQVLEIRKCRNGKGHGSNIAINFNFQNLCLDEIGLIDERGK